MERLGQAVIRAYDLGLLARAPPPGGAMAGWAGQLGPDRLGLRPVSLVHLVTGHGLCKPFPQTDCQLGSDALWCSLVHFIDHIDHCVSLVQHIGIALVWCWCGVGIAGPLF